MPDAAMKQNTRKQRPPLPGVGMARMKAAIYPMKEKMMAKTAAPPMTQVL